MPLLEDPHRSRWLRGPAGGAAIEATANRAMPEMRRVLGILRDTEPPGAALAPLPGLGQLSGLLDQLRTAGLPVDLTVEALRSP